MSESTKDFQTLLDTIASGVYGKDVRGAIHDALEAMNQRIGEVKPQTGGKQKTVYCWGDSLTQASAATSTAGISSAIHKCWLNDAMPSTSASCLTTCRQSWREWGRTQSSFQRVQFRAVQVKASLLGTQQTG